MTSNQRRVILLAVIGAIILAASAIPYKQTVSGPARIEAAVVWYVSSPAADQVITGWRRNLLNQSGRQLNMQFERPDFVEIQIAAGITGGSLVSAGDTVAWILSREGGGAVSILEAELEQAKRMLDALTAGSREQDIELARRELERTKVSLDTANVTLNRMIGLHDSGFVSLAELQQAQGSVRVLEAEVQVAEANLRAFRAGSRTQDISVGQAEVNRLERELDMARSLPGFREPIITPIGGRAKLADTLENIITIERIDTVAVVTWLPESTVPLIEREKNMSVRIRGDQGATHRAQIHVIDYPGNSLSGAYAVGLVENSDGSLIPGMTGEASCSIGKRSFLSGVRMKLGS